MSFKEEVRIPFQIMKYMLLQAKSYFTLKIYAFRMHSERQRWTLQLKLVRMVLYSVYKIDFKILLRRFTKLPSKVFPLSVDDSEIFKMLKLYQRIKYENINNPATKKMTSILNGNGIVSMFLLRTR